MPGRIFVFPSGRVLFAILFCILPALVFGRGPAAVDALGRSVSLTRPAKRIVSLSPATTEILFAIGAGDRVVGVTEFCDYPEEARTKTVVGGFSGSTVSVERIVALDSDLVLVSAEMHARVVSLLDAVGIPSFALEPRNFEEVYESIFLVGTFSGCDAGARDVVDSMRRRIEAVRERTSGSVRPSVFCELWPDPLMSAGGPTFVSEAIAAAGGRNVFADLAERWPLVSMEELFVRDPDWILVENMGGKGRSDVARGGLWSKLRAVRNGRVADIDADIIDRGGPRLAEAVEAIARTIHGQTRGGTP